MATTKKRINISLSKDIEKALSAIAKRDQMPQATKAEELIRLALELEEDRALSKIADQLNVPGLRHISHEEAWGLNS